MRWLLLPLLLQTACAAIDYRPLGEPDAGAPAQRPWTRQVGYAIDPGFFRDHPDCIIVLKPEGAVAADLAQAIEESLARPLTARIVRVVAPAERDRLACDLAVDLEEEGGQRLLARHARCRFLAKPKVTAAERVFALVWAQVSLGLIVEIVRSADGQILWTARHEVRRGDGGLPLSLLSLGGAAARAGMAVSDDEAMISMVDDALRRMVVALPDLR